MNDPSNPLDRSWKLRARLALALTPALVNCGQPDCGDPQHIPEGTEFRVEVLSAPETSESCSFVSLSAGDVLTMTAGPMGTIDYGERGVCQSPTMAGQPKGLPTNLELEACTFVAGFIMTCDVVSSDCSHQGTGGQFTLQLQQHMPKASEGSVTREMRVTYAACDDTRGLCQLVYQVAVERLAEDSPSD